MIELKHIETEKLKLPKDDEYLWRYFDIHKFLNLMQKRQFRFTRMDQFEDALEGIPFETLRRFASINRNSNLHLAGYVLDSIGYYQQTHKPIAGHIHKAIQIQASNFVSCWFCEQRESMAMWNLYSNPDGVAIKIPFGHLKEFLKPKINEIDFEEYFCGRVSYQDFKQTDPYSENALKKIKKVVLRKDISFSHEKEIRFVAQNSKSTILTGVDSEPLDFKKLKMKVVCHPRMADWKKKNIQQILKDSKLTNAFSESEIKLRY
jgi:hypothetical protein